jgi:hypothetical protein
VGLKCFKTALLCSLQSLRPRSKLSERTLPFLVVYMRHTCCSSTSIDAQQDAISTDVRRTIRSACQTYLLSQSSSRARTITHDCVMEQMSGTVLKNSFLFCAHTKLSSESMYLVTNLLHAPYSAGLKYSMAARLHHIFAYAQLLSVA